MFSFLLLLVFSPLVIVGASNLAWNVTFPHPKIDGKDILANVAGSAKSGRLHALLGPSGSGKSSLLNTLAGDVPSNLQGAIKYTPANLPKVYIQQEDILFAQLTVEETLTTSYSLSKKRGKTKQDVTSRVNSMVNALGLTKVAKTKVGDVKTRYHRSSLHHAL
jgi:ABC-type multidrug transport system ATPase subunit